jgi:N-acetylmuramoyl-L-alanine amidase
VVAPGEWLSGIAAAYGFGDPEKIWQHGNNAGLRQRRSDPNQLAAGDELFIPACEPAEVVCASGQRHTLRANVPVAELRIELLDRARTPLKDLPYRLGFGGEGADHTYVDGVTTGSGEVRAELPASCRTARLVIAALGVDEVLQVGALDPIDDDTTAITGAQGRLNNLGFMCGAVDGDHGPQTTEAVCTFQREIMGREEPDGVLDSETRSRLVDEHGS